MTRIELNAEASHAPRHMGLMAWAIRLVLTPEVVIALLVVGSLIYRISLVHAATANSIAGAVIQHDSKLFGFLLLMYALAAGLMQRARGRSGSYHLSFVARLALVFFLVLVVLYVSDVFVYHFFLTRLYAADIVTFAGEIRGGLTLLHTGFRVLLSHGLIKVIAFAVAMAITLRSLFVLLVRGTTWAFQVRYLSLAAGVLLVFAYWPRSESVYGFDDKPLYENVIERNKDYFVSTNFSTGYRRKLLSEPAPQMCWVGQQRPVSVIVLLIESLSAYDSKYFSGIEDWTPHLDQIARQETALTNFYANGWTTIGGLLSILKETFPLVPEHAAFNVYGSPRFRDFSNQRFSVPATLAREGYVTEYIGAGDLSFTDEGSWLGSIGFGKIIGGDDPRYAKQIIRGPFSSVPDRLLYDVAVDELSKMPTDRPFFVMVQTWWSHRPFMDATGRRLSDVGPVMRETDAALGEFYDRLKASGFFDRGVLIITGDHRAPEPFQKEEFRRFGLSASARIPGVVATHVLTLPHVIGANFQQTDIGTSLQSLLDRRYCLQPEQGSFLVNPVRPPSCVIHSRGDDRDLVYVRCGEKDGEVRIAGDSTRFITGKVPDEATVISTINRSRARN